VCCVYVSAGALRLRRTSRHLSLIATLICWPASGSANCGHFSTKKVYCARATLTLGTCDTAWCWSGSSISADLMAAGVGVQMEPGALDPRPVRSLGDGQPMPDQLITFVPARGDGVLRRVATSTNVSITDLLEVVTRANVDAGRQVATCLEERVKLKHDTHRQAARAVGCEFVPLVFTSLSGAPA
jgi:hypothetical protein